MGGGEEEAESTEKVNRSVFPRLIICALGKIILRYFSPPLRQPSPPVGGGGACDASALPVQEKPDPDFDLKTGSRFVNGIAMMIAIENRSGKIRDRFSFYALEKSFENI